MKRMEVSGAYQYLVYYFYIPARRSDENLFFYRDQTDAKHDPSIYWFEAFYYSIKSQVVFSEGIARCVHLEVQDFVQRRLRDLLRFSVKKKKQIIRT